MEIKKAKSIGNITFSVILVCIFLSGFKEFYMYIGLMVLAVGSMSKLEKDVKHFRFILFSGIVLIIVCIIKLVVYFL